MQLDLLGMLLRRFWQLPMQAFLSGLPSGDGMTVEKLKSHEARARSDAADLRRSDSKGPDCKAAWIPQQLATWQAHLLGFLMTIAATPIARHTGFRVSKPVRKKIRKKWNLSLTDAFIFDVPHPPHSPKMHQETYQQYPTKRNLHWSHRWAQYPRVLLLKRQS